MTDYNKYSITSVVKDFDEEEMEGRQVRFSLNTEDDVFFLIDDDTGIREDNQTLTKYATTDEDGEAGVYVYIESSVESATVKASIDGRNEQIIIFNTGIRVSSVALQTDKNTIYNGNKNENATLTATVTASETYTGVVAFYDGNTLLGTVSAVNNVATFTLESTNHSMVTPTVTRNIRAVAGGVNSNVLEITDYYTYPNLILIRPYYNGRIVTQVPENETWRLQIGLRDNRQAAVPNATGTVMIDGVEHEITLGNDGFWNYNITNGSGTGSVSVTASFGNLTESMNVGIVLHDCTDIMFSQASYTADSDGNVTLEVTLMNDNVAVPNATVSLSDGVSIYTGITNSNGVATFNLTGLTASASWTCSYSNVSDTCTVTVSSYLFYDDCSADLTSQYTDVTISSSSNSILKSYDSTENAYKVYGSGGDAFRALLIPNIRGLDNIRISLRAKLASTTAYNQLFIGLSDSITQTSKPYTADFVRIRGDNHSDCIYNDSEVSGSGASTTVRNKYVTLVMEKTGTTITMKVYDTDGTTLLRTYTYNSANNYTNPYYWFGINTRNTSDIKYIKEIKVEPI